MHTLGKLIPGTALCAFSSFVRLFPFVGFFSCVACCVSVFQFCETFPVLWDFFHVWHAL